MFVLPRKYEILNKNFQQIFKKYFLGTGNSVWVIII